MTNVYKPYKYKKITIKEIAAKKIFFNISQQIGYHWSNFNPIVGCFYIQNCINEKNKICTLGVKNLNWSFQKDELFFDIL